MPPRDTELWREKYLNTFIVTNTNNCPNLLCHGEKVSEHFYCHQHQQLPQSTLPWRNLQNGVLLPNYPEKNVVRGENVPNFKINTSENTSSNVFKILQYL